MIYIRSVFFVMTLFFYLNLSASDITRCEQSLLAAASKDKHEYVIIPSGNFRDADLVGKYADFLQKMSDSGGVLDQLGIPRTKQIVEFMSGHDMLATTSVSAALPVAHYLDGAQILQSQNRASFIYEVVFPGSQFQHGFYRDDTKYEEQLSILMHVIGHNHFAVASRFPQYRVVSNPTEAAVDLNEVIQRSYRTAPKAEVENYYLFLQTLNQLSDNYSGYYQSPKDFDLKQDAKATVMPSQEEITRKSYFMQNGLRASTENVLQAFTQRVTHSSSAHVWQKQMIELSPLLAPYRPALVHTQVMNEGWASLMQEVVMDHMGPEYNTVTHWLAAQQVTRYQSAILLSDPYWLGVRIWKRIKEKFEQQDDIKKLPTKIEKDRAFIRYAEETIISKMDDSQFINFGMDAVMIQRLGLVLTRKANGSEIGKLPPPPPGMPDPEPIVIVSRDPERVRRSVIETAVSSKVKYNPRIVLRSYNRKASGEVELVVEDDFGKNMPIEKATIGPALFALANIIQQPVSLEALFHVDRQSSTFEDFNPFIGDFRNDFFARLRVVVNSSGKLQIFTIDGKEINHQQGSQPEQKIFIAIESELHDYLERLYLENDRKLSEIESENPRFAKLALSSINQMINNMPVTSLIEHVPSAAEAILEYQSKIESRLFKALIAATANQSGGLKKTNKGLYVRALVGPKYISFDKTYLESQLESAEPAPMDLNVSNPFDGSDSGSTIIGPTTKDVGQGGWRPRGGAGGGGKPQPGQPDDGNGSLPGQESNDIEWVPLSEELYAQFLSERIQLPRLQSKNNGIKKDKNKMQGRENRRSGQLRSNETAFNAFRKGIGGLLAEGQDPMEDATETLETGFSLMRQQDYVVRKAKPFPRPDAHAVVIFARDASGSTSAYTDLYKKFVFDLKTLIKGSYPNVSFEYIIFDSSAYVMKNEDEFFKAELGGGTSYKAGIDKIMELMQQKYPAQKFDRFPFIVGDLGDYMSTDLAQAYEDMAAQSSYSGTLKAGYGADDFTNYLEGFASNNEYFGFVDLGDMPQGYSLGDLKRLLKNAE